MFADAVVIRNAVEASEAKVTYIPVLLLFVEARYGEYDVGIVGKCRRSFIADADKVGWIPVLVLLIEEVYAVAADVLAVCLHDTVGDGNALHPVG